MQQEVANAFIKNFQLTPSELTILHGSLRESPITEEFFSVVNKVQVVYRKLFIFSNNIYLYYIVVILSDSRISMVNVEY